MLPNWVQYAYCYGNPVSYTAPFGMSTLISLRNHALLDVIGLLSVIGVVADLANAVLYLAVGNIGAAAVSVVFAVVPTTFAGSVALAFGGIGICSAGVYTNASQVADDIDRISANWDSYTDEEKELEKQIIICDILGLAGSAAGSMSSAHELSRMDVYRKWEADLEKLAAEFANDNSGRADFEALVGKVGSENNNDFDISKYNGIRIDESVTKRNIQKIDYLFESRGDTMNYARTMLGYDATRMYNNNGRWIGWTGSKGEVYWGQGNGKSTFPHLNYNIGSEKGHLYLKNKIINIGVWTEFCNFFNFGD